MSYQKGIALKQNLILTDLVLHLKILFLINPWTSFFHLILNLLLNSPSQLNF